jgi:hypothetical protein
MGESSYLITLLVSLASYYYCIRFSSSFDPQRRRWRHLYHHSISSTLSATIVNDDMIPSSSSSVRTFPNWRVVNVHNNEYDSLRRSPFSHVLSTDDNHDTIAVASWSEAAYRSSLDQSRHWMTSPQSTVCMVHSAPLGAIMVGKMQSLYYIL